PVPRFRGASSSSFGFLPARQDEKGPCSFRERERESLPASAPWSSSSAGTRRLFPPRRVSGAFPLRGRVVCALRGTEPGRKRRGFLPRLFAPASAPFALGIFGYPEPQTPSGGVLKVPFPWARPKPAPFRPPGRPGDPEQQKPRSTPAGNHPAYRSHLETDQQRDRCGPAPEPVSSASPPQLPAPLYPLLTQPAALVPAHSSPSSNPAAGRRPKHVPIVIPHYDPVVAPETDPCHTTTQ
ncbi:hypothetical protein BDY21DRAFT_416867, partial [Lineolata rhizophorae]